MLALFDGFGPKPTSVLVRHLLVEMANRFNLHPVGGLFAFESVEGDMAASLLLDGGHIAYAFWKPSRHLVTVLSRIEGDLYAMRDHIRDSLLLSESFFSGVVVAETTEGG